MRQVAKRGRHWFVHRPLELWAMRVWPAAIVALWLAVIPTGGVIQPDDRVAFATGVIALAATVLHLFRPLDTRVRYIALIANEAAMLDRAAAFVFVEQIRHLPKVAIVGAVLWGTIAAAKLVVFLLSAVVVERERARREAVCGG